MPSNPTEDRPVPNLSPAGGRYYEQYLSTTTVLDEDDTDETTWLTKVFVEVRELTIPTTRLAAALAMFEMPKGCEIMRISQDSVGRLEVTTRDYLGVVRQHAFEGQWVNTGEWE